VVSDLAVEFNDFPPEYQSVLRLAQDRHNIQVKPLQELAGGWSGAAIYLVSVSSRDSGQVEHFVLKLDRVNPKARSDEITRHSRAVSQAPAGFARRHLPGIAFERVEYEGAIAIFYSIAGQSLHHYRTLSSYERQSQLEAIFSATNDVLLADWNAELTFEQAVHPQTLLERWLGFRLKPGASIERFLRDVGHVDLDTAGLLVEEGVFPNPLAYARQAEHWGSSRPIDVIVGFQHGDLNTNNILVKFSGDGEAIEGYYLIDLALFKEGLPLLFDLRYLEMSYLILHMSKVSTAKLFDLVTRLADSDALDPDQVPLELAGAAAVIRSARMAFDRWARQSYPSLFDDLWGQYWLAGVGAGLAYCHKHVLPDEARLAGLLYAAANLKRYALRFAIPMPTQVVHLPVASIAAGGPSPAGDFPSNLPVQPTAFIGREEEVSAARDMLLRDGVRLVSLTGPGGTGKSRLGLQVAAELRQHFPAGVFFVPLADLSGPDLVVSKIAEQVGVREGGSQPLLENLKDYLRDRPMLLLLDNFEHVLPAAASVADLLVAAPRLKVLVTSRAPLKLRAEHEFPVPPMRLPDDTQPVPPERLGTYESVRLFVDRAAAADPAFALTDENAPAVAEICQRLDGLPLAIELAAARVNLLSPQAMLPRLGEALKLLTGGARDLPARQHTLRSTLDWSYELLDAGQRDLFARLGIFVGGFTLEAAEAVCGPFGEMDVLDGVSSLVDNSLVRPEKKSRGEPRFRMLETIREYALERLAERGETEALGQAHARHYAGVIIEKGWARLFSAQATAWLNWIECELDNIRAALSWTQATAEGLELGPPLIDNLTWFWYRRGYFGEGRTWCERVLASPAAVSGTLRRASALMDSGMMAMWQGDLHTARAHAQESLAIWQALDDQSGLPVTLMWNGIVLLNRGEDHAAHLLLEQAQALFRQSGDSYFYGVTLVHLGNAALGLGRVAQAQAWLDQAYPLGRDIGEDWLISFALNNLGELARVQSDYDRAGAYYQESETLLRNMGDKGDLARLIHSLGYVARHQGDTRRADTQFRQSLAMFRTLGNQRGIAECLAGLAGLESEGGRLERATRLLGAAQALLNASGAAWWPADRVEVESSRAAMRANLDEDAFAAAWGAGETMSLEGAITYASQAA
jgi:predicted ATPase